MLILRKDSPVINRYRMCEEYRNLLTTINALPGIEVTSFNINRPFDEIKYSFGKIMIFLHINENDQSGLFLLTRSIDQRYWEYDSWEINLSIGDQLYKNGDRPIWYNLNRKLSDDIKLDDIFSEIKSLCKSLNEISFNKKIIEYYNIDESKISVVDDIMFNRLIKINGLLDNV